MPPQVCTLGCGRRERAPRSSLSRAFVKESDREEVITAAGPELPPGVPNRITPSGARRFRAALQAYIDERATLREDDTPEARARKALLDARIGAMERRVGTFVETETPEEPGRAVFGAFVQLADDAGNEREWQVVGVDEADPAQGRVTWASPLGKAVLGCRPGATVRLTTPQGTEELEIIAVRGPTRSG